MENRRIILILLTGLFAFSACKKLDFRSMFVSYESVNKRFEQSMDWNATHAFREIIVTEDDYEVFVMGDSHVGGTENLRSFLNAAQLADASAVIMAGDLTTGHKDDYAVFHKNLPLQDSIAWFPIAGNHDLYFNGWKEFYKRFGSSTYCFTVKTSSAQDLFICLDSGSGTLGGRQLDWLKKLLEDERDKYRNCVVITHVNFFRSGVSSATNPQVEELYVLTDLFLQCRVNFLIAGHDHHRAVETMGITSYITMDALEDGFGEASYLRLIMKGDSLEYQFVDIQK
ncbi:MAG: metallophosphoesterase [Bacteroidota bacterium]